MCPCVSHGNFSLFSYSKTKMGQKARGLVLPAGKCCSISKFCVTGPIPSQRRALPMLSRQREEGGSPHGLVACCYISEKESEKKNKTKPNVHTHTQREREKKKHTHTKKALQTSTRGNEKGNFEISHPCKKPRGRLQHFVITTARLAVGSTTIPSGLAPAQSLYQ